MSDINSGRVCAHCGAPATSEICPYCGSPTGLNTWQADMEYPVLECKEANLGFWTVAFPAVFAFGFGYAGLIMPMTMRKNLAFVEADVPMAFFLPFAVIGIVAAYLTILPIFRYILLMIKGKRITGTVYGYVDDNVLMNGRPAQVVKILVHAQDGPKFIMYQLGHTGQPYGINSQLSLVVYKDYFLIKKQRTTVQW